MQRNFRMALNGAYDLLLKVSSSQFTFETDSRSTVTSSVGDIFYLLSLIVKRVLTKFK